MDFGKIFSTIEKGVAVIKTLVAVGQDVAPAIAVVSKLITGAKAGTVTDDDLTATEASLDGMIEDFNRAMT